MAHGTNFNFYMKTIHNLETGIKIRLEDNEDPKLARFSDLIKIVIDQQQQGGFSYDDIENRIAISTALKNMNGNDTIEIEDAPYKHLVKLVDAMRWPFVHEDILVFKKEISSAK